MIGILISTFERYGKLAHFTQEQIKKHWDKHPPIFFSGLLRDQECYLNFKGDSKDWMGVTLDAVSEMRRHHFTHAYVILDDHPPMGPCHRLFLNEHLPALALKLDAAYIGLLGYGQHRPHTGVILKKEKGFLEHCPPDYQWKFSLHPGLWNLEMLQVLLEQRRTIYPEGERTIWNFERHRDQPGDLFLKPLLERCFRISGKHFLQEPAKMKYQIAREAIERFVIDVMLYVTKKRRGLLARQALEKNLLWHYGHYLGPYPLFWSGLMQQGKPHQGFEKWLHAWGDRELQREWNNFKGSFEL